MTGVMKYSVCCCFPECVARVPISLWGSGGGGVFACVCSAACRRADHFLTFQVSRSFVSRGRRGTLCHLDVFGDVSQIILRGRRNTFATFSEHALHFTWQAQHFRRGVLRVFHKLPCLPPRNLHYLLPLRAAMPMRFAENTQHDTSEVLRLPRKMELDTSKVLRLPRKMQRMF